MEKQESYELKAQKMKLFFLISLTTFKKCGCGCSLRLGVKILTVFTIVHSLISLYPLIIDAIPTIPKGFIVLLQLIFLTAALLSFQGARVNDFNTSYWGLFLYELFFPICAVYSVAFGVIWGLSWNIPEPLLSMEILFTIYFLLWTLDFCFLLYLCCILYSFTKELGLRHHDILEGKEPIEENLVSNINH